MKKLLVLSIAMLGFGLAFGQAEKKGVAVTYANGDDANAQSQLQSASNKGIETKEVDCAEAHTGTVMFHNSTGKDISMDLVNIKGEKVADIDMKANGFAYVYNLKMGEYYYKGEKDKKAKKKNLIVAMECVLKGKGINPGDIK